MQVVTLAGRLARLPSAVITAFGGEDAEDAVLQRVVNVGMKVLQQPLQSVAAFSESFSGNLYSGLETAGRASGHPRDR